MPVKTLLFFSVSFFWYSSSRNSVKGSSRQYLTSMPTWWRSALPMYRCPPLIMLSFWSSRKEQSSRTVATTTMCYKWQHLSTDHALKETDHMVLKREIIPTWKGVKNDSLHRLNSSKTGGQNTQSHASWKRKFSSSKCGFWCPRQRTRLLISILSSLSSAI